MFKTIKMTFGVIAGLFRFIRECLEWMNSELDDINEALEKHNQETREQNEALKKRMDGEHDLIESTSPDFSRGIKRSG